MLVVMESGLDFDKDRSGRNRVAYVRILQSNVETASDFYNAVKQSKQHTALVNLLEFHSWVSSLFPLLFDIIHQKNPSKSLKQFRES